MFGQSHMLHMLRAGWDGNKTCMLFGSLAVVVFLNQEKSLQLIGCTRDKVAITMCYGTTYVRTVQN